MQYLQHYYPWIIPAVLLETVLKSWALWKAARNDQQYWFVTLVIFNTAGILPLIYLLFFQHTIHYKKTRVISLL